MEARTARLAPRGAGRCRGCPGRPGARRPGGVLAVLRGVARRAAEARQSGLSALGQGRRDRRHARLRAGPERAAVRPQARRRSRPRRALRPRRWRRAGQRHGDRGLAAHRDAARRGRGSAGRRGPGRRGARRLVRGDAPRAGRSKAGPAPHGPAAAGSLHLGHRPRRLARAWPTARSGHHHRVLGLPVPLLQARRGHARRGAGGVRRQGPHRMEGQPPERPPPRDARRRAGPRGAREEGRGGLLGRPRRALRLGAEARRRRARGGRGRDRPRPGRHGLGYFLEETPAGHRGGHRPRRRLQGLGHALLLHQRPQARGLAAAREIQGRHRRGARPRPGAPRQRYAAQGALPGPRQGRQAASAPRAEDRRAAPLLGPLAGQPARQGRHPGILGFPVSLLPSRRAGDQGYHEEVRREGAPRLPPAPAALPPRRPARCRGLARGRRPEGRRRLLEDERAALRRAKTAGRPEATCPRGLRRPARARPRPLQRRARQTHPPSDHRGRRQGRRGGEDQRNPLVHDQRHFHHRGLSVR
jgi:hypothetical protein